MLVLVASCMQDFDQFFQGEETGGGGTGTGTGSGNTGNTGGSGADGGGGSGNTGGCSSPTECPGVDRDCVYRSCDANTCGFENAALDAACDDPVAPIDTGVACDGDGNCLECTTHLTPPGTHGCTGTDVCSEGMCVPEHCSNGVNDPSEESGVDCGDTCAPCAEGQACNDPTDCQSGYCNGSNICAVCTQDNQCTSAQWCDSATAGGTCAADLANGDVCTRAEQCATACSAHGDMCCDDACGDPCESCAALLTGGSNGTCAVVTTAADPYNACPNAQCSGGQETPAAVCNGTSTSCTSPSPTSCAPYVCGSTACLDACTGQGDCTTGNYCDEAGADPDECLNKKSNGAPCANSYECENFCSAEGTDPGICCQTACTNECRSCMASKTGGSNGTCGNITVDTDPDSECGADEVCNGSGACLTEDGAACSVDGNCLHGHCSDEVATQDLCCNEACTGLCRSCEHDKTGLVDGVCGNITAGNDPDTECPGASSNCNGSGACT